MFRQLILAHCLSKIDVLNHPVFGDSGTEALLCTGDSKRRMDYYNCAIHRE
jgi:hypothetical protein